VSGVFWLVAGLFVLAGLGFLLPPLLRKSVVEENPTGQKELTIKIYKDQLAELENDLKNEVIGSSQYDKAKRDIERNLLEDVGELERKEKAAANKGGKLAAIIVGLSIPVLSISMYLSLGAGEAGLDPAAATPVVQNEQHQQQNIEKMVVQLKEKLAQDPGDAEGWFMLARTSVFLRRFDDAIGAFEKLLPLGGDKDPDILTAYADTLSMSAGSTIPPKARQAIQQALMLDPFHMHALWLAATANYNDQNFEQSLKYYERMMQVMPPDFPDREIIVNNVNEVRGMLGKPALASTTEQVSNISIQGTVNLSAALAQQASPNDTVFVFARAAKGPRMPLAIVQKKVRDLPFEFVLDDSLAMNPMMKLSSVPQVVVGARISKTGDAIAKAGDLQGIVGPIQVGGTAPVNIEINETVR